MSEGELDGRTARRDRNREAVLDAVLELFNEDTLEPPAAEVAKRSGVSLRSVYRYYDDKEALLRAAIERNMVRVQPLLIVDELANGPLHTRAARLVHSRVELYSSVASMVRAALAHARTNQLLKERLNANRAVLRQQVGEAFANELSAMDEPDRDDLWTAADLLLSFESVDQLRAVRNMSNGSIERTLVLALVRLFSPQVD